MLTILDIHTHRTAPQFQALVCCTPDDFQPIGGQLYSVGIHPWKTVDVISPELWLKFEEACLHPQVKAIGECGIDLHKGGPLYLQIQVMKRQIELSETLGKPLVIHNVHAHDIIIGLKKDIKPKQNWMVHGFRGKPTVAQMLTDAGIWLSIGELHNDISVMKVPKNLMLAETDESECGITDIIRNLSSLKGEDLTPVIADNSLNFLNLKGVNPEP